jgi:hypothetical protein
MRNLDLFVRARAALIRHSARLSASSSAISLSSLRNLMRWAEEIPIETAI